jgi:hypothetical protein
MVKNIMVAFAVFLLVTVCAGRAANSVMIQQYGDETKSCNALEREMDFIVSEISRLVPQTEKTGKNVALGITGAIFLVPLFFIDLSKAEQIEINAFRQRYNHLVIIASEKKLWFRS